MAVVFAVALIAACTGTKKTAGSAGQTADNLAALDPSFAKGKHIYESNCARCHALKAPVSRSETEWATIVPNMVGRANRKAGAVVINDADQAILLDYLKRASKM
jgi:cytochrome c5